MSATPEGSLSTQPLSPQVGKGEQIIRFDDVNFSYHRGTLVLDRVKMAVDFK